jgi:hypothetical protein
MEANRAFGLSHAAIETHGAHHMSECPSHPFRGFLLIEVSLVRVRIAYWIPSDFLHRLQNGGEMKICAVPQARHLMESSPELKVTDCSFGLNGTSSCCVASTPAPVGQGDQRARGMRSNVVAVTTDGREEKGRSNGASPGRPVLHSLSFLLDNAFPENRRLTVPQSA